MKTRFLASFSALLALQLLFVGNAMAGWELDNERSTVQFMSVKNASIAELHYFHALAGEVADDGQARVSIDLDSVETLIPIRNQRLRELLFETVRFPAATLTTTVPEAVKSLENGESVGTPLAVDVELHGVSKSLEADALVTKLNDGSLQVVLSEPLIVNAADFGLDGGIEVLRDVAGLKNISTAVPVSATLVFTPLES